MKIYLYQGFYGDIRLSSIKCDYWDGKPYMGETEIELTPPTHNNEGDEKP